MRDTFYLKVRACINERHIWRYIIALRRQQNQGHLTVTLEGTRVGVKISSERVDIEWYLHACSSDFIAHFKSFTIIAI